MPWQFGALHLTESGGNRILKYADALIDGVSSIVLLYSRGYAKAICQASPNDGNYLPVSVFMLITDNIS